MRPDSTESGLGPGPDPADPGLIRAFDASGRSNVGHALETVVQIEAVRRHAELGYVKLDGGREVDFLARYPEGRSELLQVCADVSAAATRDRELQALAEAVARHKDARALVLVLTHDQVPRLGRGIEALPAYEWLLDPGA